MQCGNTLLGGNRLQPGSQIRVGRYRRDRQSIDYGTDIEASSTDQERKSSTGPDLGYGGIGSGLVLGKRIDFVRRHHLEEVVRQTS
jgi:hypothetical protein